MSFGFLEKNVNEVAMNLCYYASNKGEYGEIAVESWLINMDEIQSGSFKVIFSYDNIEEYAKYKYVILKIYGNKMISLNCCNLCESEKKDMISFANNHGLYIYEKSEGGKPC